MSSSAMPEGLPADSSVAHSIIVLSGVTTAIAISLTITRFFVRVYLVKLLGWDDFFNIISTVFSTIVCGLVVVSTSYGLGRHVEYVGWESATYALELLRISQFVIILSTITFKISIGICLLRFFTRNKTWQALVWIIVGANTIAGVMEAILIFAQCQPVSYLWDKSIQGGWCMSWDINKGTVIAQTVMTALTDFALAFLPIVFLWDIQVNRFRKAGICMLMGLGIFAGVAAIVRATYIDTLREPSDPTWDVVPTFVWAIAEANVGIIAAALPCLAPLLKHAEKAWKRHQFGYSSSKGSKRSVASSWFGGETPAPILPTIATYEAIDLKRPEVAVVNIPPQRVRSGETPLLIQEEEASRSSSVTSAGSHSSFVYDEFMY